MSDLRHAIQDQMARAIHTGCGANVDHREKLRRLHVEVDQGDSAPAWIYFYASHAQQKRWGSGSGRPARRR